MEVNRMQEVESLFDEAYEIREIEKDSLERRQVNRAALRALRDAGKLNQEELEHLEELYPSIRRPRQRRVPV